MRLLSWIVLLWILVSGSAFAQKRFEKVERFPEDIERLALGTRNASVQETAQKLTLLWQSGAFSGEEQREITRLCAVMERRNMNGIQQFEPFFRALIAIGEGEVFAQPTTLSFLAVADTTAREMGSPALLTRFFQSVEKLATDRTIYRYNNNALIIKNGDFRFTFGREAALPEKLDAAVDELIAEKTEADTEAPPLTGEETKTETPPATDDDGWGSTPASDGWGDPWATDPADDGWGTASDWDTGDDGGWGGFGGTEIGDEGAWGSTPTADAPTKPASAKPSPGSKPDPYRFTGDIPGVVKTKALVGPCLALDEVDLAIVSRYDTTYIRQTAGSVMYKDQLFVGKGGTFDWEAAGLPKGEAYVTFDQYTFSIQKAEIKAQDVELSYASKIDPADSVVGYFEFVSQAKDPRKTPTYPRFKSYFPDYEIEVGIEGVKHTGGFSLVGPKVTGSSFGLGVSTISVTKGDSLKFVAKSREPFVISPTSITNKQAELIVYRDKDRKDSIYHRAVQLRYDVTEGVLRARKDVSAYRNARFQDSYHGTSILADYLKWDLAQDTFSISMLQGRGIVPAVIESVDRFDELRFDGLQGLANFHPLVMSYNFAKLVGQSEFSTANMYDYFKRKYPEFKSVPYTTLVSSLRRLDQEDYVRFYPDLQWLELKRKGILYARAKQLKNTPPNVLKASGGKGVIDFDDIFMPSKAPGGNSITVNLRNKEMEVTGVDSIVLKVSYADTMILRIKPYPDIPIKIKENRKIEFNGQVIAKAFIYDGKSFEYSYEDHTIAMPEIDSISFRIVTDSGLVRIPNNIKATAGFLYVDIPNNKSGLRRFQDYPAFKTTKQAKVTFAGREIMDGLYKDTANFRFVVDTFQVSGLGSADPRMKRFRGDFYSGGIMNLFVDSVGIRDDGSLGFEHPVPDDGVDLYDGRGKLYHGSVVLDNSGLRSRFDETDPKADTSEIHYLAARLQSNDFLFLPDSLGLEANGPRSINRIVEPWDSTAPKVPFTRGYMIPGELNGVSFPEARFNGYELQWRVQKDSMNILVKDEPFTLYQTEDRIGKGFTFQHRLDSFSTADAALVLRKDGLFGKGELRTDRSIIRTDKFDFKQKEFSGKEAQFLITDPSYQITEVAAQNVSFIYHLGERYVDINTEPGGESQFTFPKLEYKTSLANAVWSIDDGTVAFRVDEAASLETQRFTSIKAGEDGLNFRASGANYDLKDAKLRIQGVPVIEVLDSRVYPQPGSEVVINVPDRMLPLEGAEVRIGYLTPPDSPLGSEQGSHVLTDASISIRSATRFQGKGTYNYINELGERQQIALDRFEPTRITESMLEDSVKRLDLAKQKLVGQEGTRSSTLIKEEDNFIVEEGKIFRGEMVVKAWKLKPDFVGETRLVLEGKDGLWTEYNTEKGKTEIELGKGKKEAGVVGLFYSDNGRFYALLNKPLTDKAAEEVMLAEGTVAADMARKVVRAIAKEKDTGLRRAGNFIEYIPAAVKGGGEVYFEGNFKLLNDNKNILLTPGRGRGNVGSGEYTLDILLALQFDKPKETFKMIGDDLEEYLALYRLGEGIERTIRRNEPKLLHKIAELQGDKEAENFQKRFETGSSTPSALNSYGLVFSDLILKFSKKRNAFYSYGMIGVSNAYKSNLDARVPGYVEIIPKGNPAGPALNIYLEFSPEKWYLIQYEGKDLQIQTSNEALATMLKDPKANKDKFDYIEDEGARNAFISRFRGNYGDHSLETDLPNVGSSVK